MVRSSRGSGQGGSARGLVRSSRGSVQGGSARADGGRRHQQKGKRKRERWSAAQGRGREKEGGVSAKKEKEREREREKTYRIDLKEEQLRMRRGERIWILYINMWAKFKLSISNLGLLVGLRIYILKINMQNLNIPWM